MSKCSYSHTLKHSNLIFHLQRTFFCTSAPVFVVLSRSNSMPLSLLLASQQYLFHRESTTLVLDLLLIWESQKFFIRIPKFHTLNKPNYLLCTTLRMIIPSIRIQSNIGAWRFRVQAPSLPWSVVFSQPSTTHGFAAQFVSSKWKRASSLPAVLVKLKISFTVVVLRFLLFWPFPLAQSCRATWILSICRW